MQQKLEEKDENTLEIKETFSSLQQEVDMKTKKLKKASFAFSVEQTVNVVVLCAKDAFCGFSFSSFPCLSEMTLGTNLVLHNKTFFCSRVLSAIGHCPGKN